MPRKGEYQPHVKHELRDCPVHGLTPFAERIESQGGHRRYRCMKCDDERKARDRARGEAQPRTLTLEPSAPGPACRSCFVELSLAERALGQCTECREGGR